MHTLILAAGEGKRIKSEISASNKCLIDINGISLIENSLNNIVNSIPISGITIVVGYGAKDIEERIGKKFKDIPVNYVTQENIDGVLGALFVGLKDIDDDIIVQLGDEYYLNPYYKDGIDKFLNNACVFGVCKGLPEQVKETYSIKYSDEGKPIEFCEKPTNPFNNYVGTGMVFLKKHIFKIIKRLYLEKDKRELVDIFREVIRQGEKIESFICTDFYENVNKIENYNRIIKNFESKDLNKYFFGIFKELYKLNNNGIEVINFYQSKFSEVYESLCHSSDTGDENELAFKETEFYRSYLALSHGKKVLELACGSGRITIPFAMQKIEITGVDICSDMLNILEEKVLKSHKKCKKYITLVKDDITNLKKINEKFNLIIFPATTIRLIEMDLAKFIDHIYDYVEDGGYFIFDNNEIKNNSSKLVVENKYNISYDKDNIKNILFFEEQHDFSSMKTRVNFYLSVFGDEIKHYLSYTYLNLIDKKTIEEAVSHTRFSEVKFKEYFQDDETSMYFCILKK